MDIRAISNIKGYEEPLEVLVKQLQENGIDEINMILVSREERWY